MATGSVNPKNAVNTDLANSWKNAPANYSIDDAIKAASQGSQQGQSYTANQQSGPYRGGLLTDYRGGHAADAGYDANQGMTNYAAMYDNDADVRGASSAQNELDKEANGDTGVSSAEQTALLNMYKGRIGMKNSLSEQIGSADENLTKAQDLNKSVSGQAVGEGLKNTRQNYNGRGLLYSGMRQGGEQQVRTTGASQLASAMAGTARDSANAKSAAQNAYASVDLANQQDMLKRSEEAFDTSNANSIARRQAMQQLGSGVGSAIGTYMGGRGPSTPSGGSYSNPASGYDFNSNGMQRTGLLAEGTP